MKLGVVGLLPDWHAIDAAAAQRVRAAGFRGATLLFPRPLEADPDDLRRLKEALRAGGLEPAQANGMYVSLVHPDEDRRAEGVRGLQAMIHIGHFLEAHTVYVRPGSVNPNNVWYPHPANQQPETFDRLVASLRQAAATAQAEGVTLALEGHVVSPVDSAQRARQVLDAVGSPALMFNLDIVNFVGSVATAHDPSGLIAELLALLGRDTAAVHIKDVALEDRHVVHITEAPLGQGTIDFTALLPQLDAVCPEVYCLIEHLPDDQIPAARAHFCEAARRAGVRLES